MNTLISEEKKKINSKAKYKLLKEKGICIQCKKRKAIENKVRCGICLYDDRIYRESKRK